jgi:glyoxylase-like metal-dependent hydrolase (beta-lactamase superfamily II)
LCRERSFREADFITTSEEGVQTYTIHPLAVGVNRTDQGIMTYQKDYGRRIWLPIYAFYLRGGGKHILVDTGLDEFVLPDGAEDGCGFPIHDFETALETVGLTPADIDVIIHTHLHNDHCENDYKCPRARVIVQRIDLDFFRQPHPLDHRYYADLLDGVEVETVTGDVELFPGIEVILSPGHTPGGQSVLVNTTAGRAAITGFCCNGRNFPKVGPAVTPGVHTDALQAYDSIQKLKAMADILIPLHEPQIGRQAQIPTTENP